MVLVFGLVLIVGWCWCSGCVLTDWSVFWSVFWLVLTDWSVFWSVFWLVFGLVLTDGLDVL